jgi:hypothetical protein
MTTPSLTNERQIAVCEASGLKRGDLDDYLTGQALLIGRMTEHGEIDCHIAIEDDDGTMIVVLEFANPSGDTHTIRLPAPYIGRTAPNIMETAQVATAMEMAGLLLAKLDLAAWLTSATERRCASDRRRGRRARLERASTGTGIGEALIAEWVVEQAEIVSAKREASPANCYLTVFELRGAPAVEISFEFLNGDCHRVLLESSGTTHLVREWSDFATFPLAMGFAALLLSELGLSVRVNV